MKKYILSLLAGCLVYSVQAKDYPVSDITTFNAAVKQLQAGDRVVLRKGVWNDAALVFHGEGTKDKPVTLTVEEMGTTTLEGNSSLQIYGDYVVVEGLVFINGCTPTGQVIEFRKGSKYTANNSVLRNCVIDRYNKADRLVQDAWVNLWGRNNTVEYCYFGGKTNLGTTLIVWPNGEGHNRNYHHIYRNYFAARPRLGANGGETMRIGTSQYSLEVSGTVVEGNYFEHCNGEVEIISVKSCENRIIDNTFFESEGSVVLRHGHRNEVSGNYFLGNNKSSTGGIRVINEGHKIFNNYFYQLKGKDFRGPLVVMNGVPNSVAHRYHQIKDVDIMFNTWVDCELPWQLCVGSDEERTAIPLNTRIAHNVVYCPDENELIKAFDKTTGITMTDNLLIGKQGVEKGTGFVQGSVDVQKSSSGLPVVLSKVKTKDSTGFVTTDINGSKRATEKTIGAFESAKITKEIASAANSGPRWYIPYINTVANNSVTLVSPGKDALKKAISKSKEGDILELKEGEYTASTKLVIPHSLTIRAAKGASKPTIKAEPGSAVSTLVEIGSGLNLVIDGLSFDGQLEKPVKYALTTACQGITTSYNIYINNCEFANFTNNEGGAIYKAYKGSFADTLKVTNSVFRDSYRGFALNDEKDAKGFYSAEFMTFDNVVFKNITQWAIDFLRGGNDESTLGGHLLVDHCVFDNVNNNERQTIIKHVGLINIDIRNSVFFNSPNVKSPVRLSGRHNTFDCNNVYEAGKVAKTDGAKEGANNISIAPSFRQGTYIPDSKSGLIGKASDKTSIGLHP